MTATTATTMLAEPTCALTGASLEAAADYEEARGERACAVEAFRAAVHPKVWELYQTLEEPEGKARDAELDLHIAEFCRHFPGAVSACRVIGPGRHFHHTSDCQACPLRPARS